MGRGRRSYTLRGSPTKNWSKLLSGRHRRARRETGQLLCRELVIANPLRSALASRGASDLIHLGAARVIGQTPPISILAILDNLWTKEA